jgi:hypothetical protein
MNMVEQLPVHFQAPILVCQLAILFMLYKALRYAVRILRSDSQRLMQLWEKKKNGPIVDSNQPKNS